MQRALDRADRDAHDLRDVLRRQVFVEAQHDALALAGGQQVDVAHDGLEALEAANRIKPDVVLLDLGMPRLNGYDACRRIRQEPWSTNTVVIALTGWGQEEDRRKTGEAGFNAHVVKPVTLPMLEKLWLE